MASGKEWVTAQIPIHDSGPPQPVNTQYPACLHCDPGHIVIGSSRPLLQVISCNKERENLITICSGSRWTCIMSRMGKWPVTHSVPLANYYSQLLRNYCSHWIYLTARELVFFFGGGGPAMVGLHTCSMQDFLKLQKNFLSIIIPITIAW